MSSCGYAANLGTYLDMTAFTLLTSKSRFLVCFSDGRVTRHVRFWWLEICLYGERERAYTLNTPGSESNVERRKERGLRRGGRALGFQTTSDTSNTLTGRQSPWRNCEEYARYPHLPHLNTSTHAAWELTTRFKCSWPFIYLNMGWIWDMSDLQSTFVPILLR